MITYVSAFFLLPNSKRSVDEYRMYFDKIVALGIPIVLFLDSQLQWTFPSHIYVIPYCIADSWVSQTITDTCILPLHRSNVDGIEYMRIMNSKSEFVLKTSILNPFQTEWFAWIDFGLPHVFRTPEVTLSQIKALEPPSVPCMRTAGIWSSSPNDLINQVCWRFAGGFFLIHQSLIQKFHDVVKQSIQEFLPRVTWEVNIWADVERKGMDLGWFASDHNDSIVSFKI